MAGYDRWIQDALDAWLSPEAGTGPEGDEGWRERTGYFNSPFQGGKGDAAAPSAPPAAPAADAAPPAPAATPAPGGSWLAEDYEEHRAALRTAMAGFKSRLLYAFPDRNAMTIDDLAAAGGWIADVERQVHLASGWAILHRHKGRPELGREVDAALAELAQLKQVYALQRKRIEQRDAARAREINRNTADFIREQEANRRKLAEETDDYIRDLRRQSDRDRQRISDERHRDFIAYLRGESVIEIRRR